MLIAKSFTFDAAHRLPGHKAPDGSVGKCANIHGHTYKVVVGIEGPTNPGTGFVVDFATIKETVKKWVMDNWDHALIYLEHDTVIVPLLPRYFEEFEQENLETRPKTYPMKTMPTAENMAQVLYVLADHMIPSDQGAKIAFIEIWETPTSMARCEGFGL